MKKTNAQSHLYILSDSKLQDTDIGIGLSDVMDSLAVSFKFSESMFNNSLLWLSAKENGGDADKHYVHETDICLIYYNNAIFTKDYESGQVDKDLGMIKSFFGQEGIKVLIMLQSVGDTLFNNSKITRQMYDDFLISLTVKYQFDYIELKTTEECFKLICDVHKCLEKKDQRKEINMGELYTGAKGAKDPKKAHTEGFTDKLSKYWISMLMSIPGVSEDKAIAISSSYPTFNSLSKVYDRRDLSNADKIKLLIDIEVRSTVGDENNKKIGKKISERVYHTICSTDPDRLVD